jgi:hypothetical protein
MDGGSARRPHAGFGVDEQLRDVGGRQPFSVSRDDLDDVFRLAVDRQLAWPGQSRPTPGGSRNGRRYSPSSPGSSGRTMASGRTRRTRCPGRPGRSLPGSAGRRTPAGRARAGRRARTAGDRLHVSDALDRARVTAGPAEPESAAPVVQDQCHPLDGADLVEERVQVSAVVDEPVRPIQSGVRVAHADQVGCDAATQRLDVRNHVAPPVGRGTRRDPRCPTRGMPSSGRARTRGASRSSRSRVSLLLVGPGEHPGDNGNPVPSVDRGDRPDELAELPRQ